MEFFVQKKKALRFLLSVTVDVYKRQKYEFDKDKDAQIKNILEKIGEVSFVKPCNAEIGRAHV